MVQPATVEIPDSQRSAEEESGVVVPSWRMLSNHPHRHIARVRRVAYWSAESEQGNTARCRHVLNNGLQTTPRHRCSHASYTARSHARTLLCALIENLCIRGKCKLRSTDTDVSGGVECVQQGHAGSCGRCGLRAVCHLRLPQRQICTAQISLSSAHRSSCSSSIAASVLIRSIDGLCSSEGKCERECTQPASAACHCCFSESSECTDLCNQPAEATSGCCSDVSSQRSDKWNADERTYATCRRRCGCRKDYSWRFSYFCTCIGQAHSLSRTAAGAGCGSKVTGATACRCGCYDWYNASNAP
jgi:hypothetical protein